jgi:CheY-like chemotaxis protein
MVYDIVKQSGSYIFVESKSGKGATFKIYLPQVDEEVTRPQPERVFRQIPKGTETILIADEDIVRALTRQILEECGYRVIEARNGVEALSFFEQPDCKIDLLIADIVMPQMGGQELAERILPAHPSIPVLFASGYSDEATILRAKSEFGANFMKKPFNP